MANDTQVGSKSDKAVQPPLDDAALAAGFKAALNAPGEYPPPLSIEIRRMPVLTKVGYTLARGVLTLTGLAVLILIVVFGWAEFATAPKRELSYEKALSIAADGLERGDPRMAWLSARLAHAARNPSAVISKQDIGLAQVAIDEVLARTDVDDAEKAALKACWPLPAADKPGRPELLRQCAAIIDAGPGAHGAFSERVKLIEGLQKQAADERGAFRSFWLQMAQMILLNLFLPLLTALLGYIFGSQQAQKDEPG